MFFTWIQIESDLFEKKCFLMSHVFTAPVTNAKLSCHFIDIWYSLWVSFNDSTNNANLKSQDPQCNFTASHKCRQCCFKFKNGKNKSENMGQYCKAKTYRKNMKVKLNKAKMFYLTSNIWNFCTKKQMSL